ncbi:MAG: glycosyltransferase family 1 protein [Bacteroidales bacterium]|nr:glycosyltransferase family 1 protein [Bacteroidales bacterium]
MKTDILYVANSRGVMRRSVEYTMQKGIPVSIYGTNWENLLPPGMIKGNYILNEELRKYYSNCNILLNDHWADMTEEGYISNRIFDALACGSIVLTDRVKGIEKTFHEGLFYYSNADELAEQTRWIRDHMQEAKQMALKNSKIVLENHTFDIRAERILEVALQIHHQKTNFAQADMMKRPNVWRRFLDFNRINPVK